MISVFRALVAVVLACAFIMALFPASPVSASVAPNATIRVNIANVRSDAKTSASLVSSLSCGHRIQITGEVNGDTVNIYAGGRVWYKIDFVDVRGNTKTGYVFSQLVSRDVTITNDPAFEESIKDFPESYKPYLRALHELYPLWTFEAQLVNLNFNTVVNEQSLRDRSLVHNIRDESWRSTYTYNDATQPGWTSRGGASPYFDAYNWSNDSYIVYDRGGWVKASPEIIAFYLDPRNFLTDVQVFQFLSLSYDENRHNIETVGAMLSGSFMDSGTIKDNDNRSISYAEAFMQAAEISQVNPYFLVARCRHEVVLSNGSPSGSASGTYSGLEGYYNFYNIRAYSGSDPIRNGLLYAKKSGDYQRPWDTQYKAIVGGAQWIDDGYISVGQDTLYLQKWQVVPVPGRSLYTHQYMQNIEAPAGEAGNLYSAYSSNRGGMPPLSEQALHFKIPVYNNMPDSPARPPTTLGNPNNWLKSISVDGQSLTPTFDPNTLRYDLIIDGSVDQVNVTAQRVTNKATIVSGTGQHNLRVGNNTISIKVRAQNGSERVYTLNIIRLDPNQEPRFTTTYNVHGTSISGISLNQTTDSVLSKVNLDAGHQAYITDFVGTKITSSSRKIRTGDALVITDASGEVCNYFIISVRGDISGTGIINSTDLTMLGRALIGEVSLDEVRFRAADVNGDGRLNSVDLTRFGRHLIQEEMID